MEEGDGTQPAEESGIRAGANAAISGSIQSYLVNRPKISSNWQQNYAAVMPSQTVVCAGNCAERAGERMRKTTILQSGSISLYHECICNMFGDPEK